MSFAFTRGLRASVSRRGLGILVAAAVAGVAVPAVAADITIPVIVKDTTSNYWQIVLAGARKAGKELGIKVPELGAQSEADINGQISILENAVAGKPAAIVISPTQATALGKPIDKAAASVPIIMIDSGADTTAYKSFLTTDNEVGGKIAADGLAEGIKAKTGKAEGEVALINNLPGAGSLMARDKGFKEEIAAKYPGLKLVAEKVSDGTANGGLNIMTDLLTAYPNLAGVFADNQIQGEGASQALTENKNKKVTLVAFDADDKLIKGLKDGYIYALLVQDPFRMGYQGVKDALAASQGKPLERNVDTGANLITKANMNGAKEKSLLFPKLK